MTGPPIVDDDPFDPAPPDEVAERDALVRAIELSRGFSLLMACCNRADHRDRLMGDILARLPGLRVQLLPLREPIRSLLIELRSRLESPTPDAIFVYGIEGWLTAGTEAEDTPFIRNLNAARNHFPKEVPIPLVFWIPQHILAALARAAPDFFSVRSGFYSFQATPRVRDRDVESLASDGLVGMAGLRYDEKLERVDALAAMLAEYEALPPTLRDPLAELRLLNSLATLQQILANLDVAESLFRKVLKVNEELFGPDNPSTATSLNNLAYLCYLQGLSEQARGRYEEARGWYEEAGPIHTRALSIRQSTSGPDDPSVARSLNDLGILFIAQGRLARPEAARDWYAKAERILLRALKIREATLGPNDPVTAKTLNNLAICHQSQGRFLEAESLFSRASKIKDNSLGPNYPGTATSLNNEAGLYQSQGRYAEAEPLYRRALKIREEYLGPDHPDTTHVREYYAALLHRLGREDEAMEMTARAQAAREAHSRRNAKSSDGATSR